LREVLVVIFLSYKKGREYQWIIVNNNAHNDEPNPVRSFPTHYTCSIE
jgi:hypothetical protein